MEKATPHRKKQFVPNVFKFLVAVSSLAGTLGIWNLLANKDVIQANIQNTEGSQPSANPNLEPLPTLVSLITVDLTSIKQASNQPATVPVAALRIVTPPVTVSNNQSASSVVSNNLTSPAVIPAPITTTQSSKPKP